MLMLCLRCRAKLQILIDEDRYELLERESERTGRPGAELIRRSVDQVYGVDRGDRRAALESLLAEGPMPVGDWDVMKQDMVGSLLGSRE
jgi:hypothetical protein